MEEYNTKYPWGDMSATVHKILYHGGDIIKHYLVPKRDLPGKYFETVRTKVYSICCWQHQHPHSMESRTSGFK